MRRVHPLLQVSLIAQTAYGLIQMAMIGLRYAQGSRPLLYYDDSTLALFFMLLPGLFSAALLWQLLSGKPLHQWAGTLCIVGYLGQGLFGTCFFAVVIMAEVGPEEVIRSWVPWYSFLGVFTSVALGIHISDSRPPAAPLAPPPETDDIKVTGDWDQAKPPNSTRRLPPRSP